MRLRVPPPDVQRFPFPAIHRHRESFMSEPSPQKNFAQQAEEKEPGLIAELFDFLRSSKKWWLLPILLVLGLVGLLVLLSSSALAPFIYPLF